MKKILLYLILLCSLFVNAQDFWTQVSYFPDQEFLPKQISIVDANIIWAHGTNASIPGNGTQQWFRTTDGGSTWTQGNINLGDDTLQVNSLHAVSDTVAYVSVNSMEPGPLGGIWVTLDAGATWTRQPNSFTSPDSFPNFVYLRNATDGIAVGNPSQGYFEIYKTSNAGQNWTRVPASNIASPLQDEKGYALRYDVKNNSVWFGTNKGRIFRSNDFGEVWYAAQSPLSDFDGEIYKGRFAFKNENEGLLIDDYWLQRKSSDSGSTWYFANAENGAARNGNITFVPETTNTYFSWGEEIMVGMRGASYTTDSGTSWIDLNETDQKPIDVPVAEFRNYEVGFCFGYYHLFDPHPEGLFFFKLGEDTLHRLLNIDNPILTNKFSAVPNPATDMVKIYGKNIKSVTVFDVSGKKVLTKNYSISNEVSLDISKLQNGIYLTEITSNSEMTSTIKIVKK